MSKVAGWPSAAAIAAVRLVCACRGAPFQPFPWQQQLQQDRAWLLGAQNGAQPAPCGATGKGRGAVLHDTGRLWGSAHCSRKVAPQPCLTECAAPSAAGTTLERLTSCQHQAPPAHCCLWCEAAAQQRSTPLAAVVVACAQGHALHCGLYILWCPRMRLYPCVVWLQAAACTRQWGAAACFQFWSAVTCREGVEW